MHGLVDLEPFHDIYLVAVQLCVPPHPRQCRGIVRLPSCAAYAASDTPFPTVSSACKPGLCSQDAFPLQLFGAVGGEQRVDGRLRQERSGDRVLLTYAWNVVQTRQIITFGALRKSYL